MYSSAIFADAARHAGSGASAASSSASARSSTCSRSDHLVEIGTGWGGFALHAARNYGCHVTTTTISREQHALAARARRATPACRIASPCCCEDYRDLEGSYDKLVSIEMIEAIGHQYLDTYFGQVRRRCSSPTAWR